MKPTEGQLEVIARELFESVGSGRLWEDVDRATREAVHAAARRIWNLIVPMVLEEAAKALDAAAGRYVTDWDHAFAEISDRIRSLKDEP